MTEKEVRERANQALAMAERYQDRCHSAEEILAELFFLPWWKFSQRRKIKKKFIDHYNRFVNVSFTEFIEQK